MNNYGSLSHKFHNKTLKLYFTKKELTRILEYYSFGVSKGEWKDYAIDFTQSEAYFHFYRNFYEKPIISISKKKSKKSKINNFELRQGYNKFLFNTSLNNLFSYLKRKNLKLVKK